MVRPGLKRLQQAQRVKVQPNKTGTSFMLGQSVYLRGAQHSNIAGGKLLKKGVAYDSSGNTPYNNLPDSKTFTPTYTQNEKDKVVCCNQIKQKVFPVNSENRIIGVTYPSN